MDANAQQFTWQKSAGCNGVPSYIFFPDETKLPGFKEDPKFRGKTFEDYCGPCRVRSICKEFALLHDTWGVWGGTKKGERDRLYPVGERNEMRALKAESNTYFPLHGEKNLDEDFLDDCWDEE